MWRVFVALGVLARAESVKNASAVHKSLPPGWQQSPECKACCCIFLYRQWHFRGPAFVIDSQKDRPVAKHPGEGDPSVSIPWNVSLPNEGWWLRSIKIQGDCWIQYCIGDCIPPDQVGAMHQFSLNKTDPELQQQRVFGRVPLHGPGNSWYYLPGKIRLFFDVLKTGSQGRWVSVGDLNGGIEHAVTMGITNTNTNSSDNVNMKELSASITASTEFLGVGVEATVSGTLSESISTGISHEFQTSVEKTDTFKCPEKHFEHLDPALKAAMWQWHFSAACYVVQTSHFQCTAYRKGSGKPLCSYLENCANFECTKCCCVNSPNASFHRPDCVDCDLHGDVWFGSEDWDCKRRSGSGCSDAALPHLPDATSGAELRANSAWFTHFHLNESVLGAKHAASQAFSSFGLAQKTPVFVLEDPLRLFDHIYTRASNRIMNTLEELEENPFGKFGGYVFLWVRGVDVDAQILAWQRPADGADLGEPEAYEAARVQVKWRASRDTGNKFTLVQVTYRAKEEEPVKTKDSDTLRPFMPVILP